MNHTTEDSALLHGDELTLVVGPRASLAEFVPPSGALRFAVTPLRPGDRDDLELLFCAGGLELPAALREAVLVHATYRRRGSIEGSRPAALGGVLVGLTECGDAAREDEFHRYYDEHHAIDVVRSGFYATGARYDRVSGKGASYLAVYGTEGSEPETFQKYLAWPARDKTRCEVFVVSAVYAARRADLP